jgi:hypothetical protein
MQWSDSDVRPPALSASRQLCRRGEPTVPGPIVGIHERQNGGPDSIRVIKAHEGGRVKIA